ncbi:MAG: DUF3563 family protein, partial [Caldimonas sp.]
MINLLSILRSVIPSVESQSERDEAYLAAAVDLRDLERRMREIDGRGRTNWSPIASG